MISDSLFLHPMALFLISLIIFFCVGKSKITGIKTIVTALTDSYWLITMNLIQADTIFPRVTNIVLKTIVLHSYYQ